MHLNSFLAAQEAFKKWVVNEESFMAPLIEGNMVRKTSKS